MRVSVCEMIETVPGAPFSNRSAWPQPWPPNHPIQPATHLRQQRLGLRQVRQAAEDGQQADAQLPALLGILPQQTGQRLQQHGVRQQRAQAAGVAQQLRHRRHRCRLDAEVFFIQCLLQQLVWHCEVCRLGV